MMEHRPRSTQRRRSARPPFARVLCVVGGGDQAKPAIVQALTVAGPDGRVTFAAADAATAEAAVARAHEAA